MLDWEIERQRKGVLFSFVFVLLWILSREFIHNFSVILRIFSTRQICSDANQQHIAPLIPYRHLHFEEFFLNFRKLFRICHIDHRVFSPRLHSSSTLIPSIWRSHSELLSPALTEITNGLASEQQPRMSFDALNRLDISSQSSTWPTIVNYSIESGHCSNLVDLASVQIATRCSLDENNCFEHRIGWHALHLFCTRFLSLSFDRSFVKCLSNAKNSRWFDRCDKWFTRFMLTESVDLAAS